MKTALLAMSLMSLLAAKVETTPAEVQELTVKASGLN